LNSETVASELPIVLKILGIGYILGLSSVNPAIPYLSMHTYYYKNVSKDIFLNK
jgi:hypothetical protein